VFLGNLILHPERVRKTKSQPAGVFGTEGLRVMTVSGTAFEKFPPD